MLNRRDVLKTAPALALGAGAFSATSVAAVSQAQETQNSGESLADATSLCCAATAKLASEIADAGELHKDRLAAANVLLECSRVCQVISLKLLRGEAVSPALCQANADACERVISIAGRFHALKHAQSVQQIAEECADACRVAVCS